MANRGTGPEVTNVMALAHHVAAERRHRVLPRSLVEPAPAQCASPFTQGLRDPDESSSECVNRGAKQQNNPSCQSGREQTCDHLSPEPLLFRPRQEATSISLDHQSPPSPDRHDYQDQSQTNQSKPPARTGAIGHREDTNAQSDQGSTIKSRHPLTGERCV
jgi:hypothetical protein